MWHVAAAGAAMILNMSPVLIYLHSNCCVCAIKQGLRWLLLTSLTFKRDFSKMWSKRSFFLGIVLPWILGGIIGFADDQYYENDDNISLIDYDEEYKDDAGGGKYYDDLEGGGRSSFRQLENQQDDICKEMKAKVRQLLNTRNRGGRRKGGGRTRGGRRGRVKRRRGRYTRDKGKFCSIIDQSSVVEFR